MNSSSLVSIIVPVYNVEQYLSKCLDSLINQTYRNLEIICVNDGSKDESYRILDQYSKRDSRIVIVNQDNQGLSCARNTGMQYVHGLYLMFVDSDDWIDIDTCESAINCAEKYNADLVFWGYIKEYADRSVKKSLLWDNECCFDDDEVKKYLHKRLFGLDGVELSHPEYANSFETAWGKLYKSTIVLDNHVKFVDTSIIGTEDALFNIEAIGYVNKAVYLDKCMNHYRKDNSDSLTSKYKPQLFNQWQTLFDYMEAYITQNDLSVDYKHALNNRIALSLIGLGLNVVSSQKREKEKIQEIKDIIKTDRYCEAYKNLPMKYFPFHWKVFFEFARIKYSYGIYGLLIIIKSIVGR